MQRKCSVTITHQTRETFSQLKNKEILNPPFIFCLKRIYSFKFFLQMTQVYLKPVTPQINLHLHRKRIKYRTQAVSENMSSSLDIQYHKLLVESTKCVSIPCNLSIIESLIGCILKGQGQMFSLMVHSHCLHNTEQ